MAPSTRAATGAAFVTTLTIAGCSTLLGLSGDYAERGAGGGPVTGAAGGGGGHAGGAGGGVAHGGGGSGGTSGGGNGGGSVSTGGGPADGGVDADASGPACGDPCYGGPDGTLFAGSVCHGGTWSCDGGGHCEGEVLPSVPDVLGNDDDCNGVGDLGAAPRAIFAMPASVALGGKGPGAPTFTATRLTPAGDAVVVGGVPSHLCTDVDPQNPCGEGSQGQWWAEPFVAVLDTTLGTVKASKTGALSMASRGAATAVALDAAGATAWVGGAFAGGPLGFGPQQSLAPGGTGSCFAASFTLPGLTPSAAWAFAHGCTGVSAVLPEDDGSVTLGGSFMSAEGLTLGDEVPPIGEPSGKASDGFVVHASASGEALWAWQLKATPDAPSEGFVRVQSLLRATSGELWVAGDVKGRLTMTDTQGTTVVDLHQTSAGKSDVFVIVLRADGTVKAARACGSAEDDTLAGLARAGGGVEVLFAATVGLGAQFNCSNHGYGGVDTGPVLVRLDLGTQVTAGGTMSASGSATAKWFMAHPGGGFVIGGDLDGYLFQQPNVSDGIDGWLSLLDPAAAYTTTRLVGGADVQHLDAMDVSPWTGALFGVGRANGAVSVPPLPKLPVQGADAGFGVSIWP
jgi:hypothetical protein